MLRRVVLAGASGLIGSALSDRLRADGVEVTTLVRRPTRAPYEITWHPEDGVVPQDALAAADAVVALNGASIGRIPWTPGYKSTLLWSRLTPTRVLARALGELGADAPHFVSASAVGFYGSAPRCTLDESSPGGAGFLAELCREWEASARRAGDRVTLLRTAPIVHPQGVLAPLMLLTRAGLAGPIGRGNQVWPWISLHDEVEAIRHVLHEQLVGPVNLTGPTRATANDLGFALARRMNRPFLLRAPLWAMRAVLGRDMVDAVLASDAHVVPAALTASGFTFRHATVEDAVAAVVPAR